MSEVKEFLYQLNGADHDKGLQQAIEKKFDGDVKCFTLPPTFVAGKCGVDVQTSAGVVTVVWKAAYDEIDNSVFSMCVVDGCSRDFKQRYKAKFKRRYTELDGLQSVFGAIESVLTL